MEENPDICSNCGNLPQDILMLACNHDLCLDCSANIFCAQQLKLIENFVREFECQLCKQITTLDESSVVELQRIAKEKDSQSLYEQPSQVSVYKQQNSEFTDQPQHFKQSPQIYSESEVPELSQLKASMDTENHFRPQTSITQSVTTTQSIRQSRGYCVDHPEEELSYFCFDCLTDCICPECVIHGVHKNHEVQTIRKSYPIVQARLEELKKGIQQKSNAIQQNKTKVTQKKQQVLQQSSVEKEEVVSLFQQLRNMCDQQEKKILKELDQVTQQNMEKTEQVISNMNGKQKLCGEALENIINFLQQKSKVTTLNYFSRNQKTIKKNIIQDQSGNSLVNTLDKELVKPNLANFQNSMKLLQNQLNNMPLVQHNVVKPQQKVFMQNHVLNITDQVFLFQFYQFCKNVVSQHLTTQTTAQFTKSMLTQQQSGLPQKRIPQEFSQHKKSPKYDQEFQHFKQYAQKFKDLSGSMQAQTNKWQLDENGYEQYK